MKYNITKADSYSLASITEKKSELVVAKITVDTHDQNSAKNQAVHLMYSDALLSGSGKMSREKFLDSVNKLGASIGISIADGKVNITLKCLDSKFATLLKLTEQMILEPSFKASELKRIKLTTTNELHEAKEDAKQISHSELLNVLYGTQDRRYTFSPDSTVKALKQITKSDITKLHQTVLTQPWVCSIAGNKEAVKKIASRIKKIKKQTKNSQEITATHEPKAPANKIILKDIPSRSNIEVNFGAPVDINLDHEDYMPLAFGMSVLAKWGGFSGRLMSTVREKEGLTYGIYGKLEGFSTSESGNWTITTFFDPGNVKQGLESTLRELKKIHKEGIIADEFRKFKSILKTQQTLLQDSVYKLLADLHSFHCQGFSIKEMEKFKNQIDTLTIEDVNKAVKTYLDPDSVTISCAGPVSKVKKQIQSVIKN